MSFLRGSVVLSELRKAKPSRDATRWVKSQDADRLFISVVSIGEIECGIEKVRKADPGLANALAF